MTTLEEHVESYDGSKLIDIIQKRIETNEKFFSLEFFTPYTFSGACNLLKKCQRLSEGKPLFYDVTFNSKNLHLQVASSTQNITKCHTMIQLSSSSMSEESALLLLNDAKSFGLSTVMVIEGDPIGCFYKDFLCSSSLINFIKRQFGDFFTICVTGYTNSCSLSSHNTFLSLQSEIAAGADFIITNVVFDANEFLHFVESCRKFGINVPIIPGILPIQSYGCVKQLHSVSNIKIPDRVMNILKPICHNDEAVLKYGIFLTVELCKILLNSALCCGLHFFTLNREFATIEILKTIGLWQEVNLNQKLLPWHSSSNVEQRCGEEVRPIFWGCRPGSYLHRTSKWEEFPNGRWGDSSMAAFGSFRDYHLLYLKLDNDLLEFKKMWGEELTCDEDVYNVFVAFLSGTKNKTGHMVTHFPWTEENIASETNIILDDLIYINSNGFLTTNSQPNVNAVASTHKVFGWGNPGGYVFQKAYLEFFCSENDVSFLMSVLKEYPLVNYHIVNQSGTINHTNTDSESSNAVTWGVFTGKPVIQPTVVDPVAFQYWKDEAFDIWLQQWGRLYDENSRSYKIIKHFYDTFYLVNLVDNDYVKGNCLFEVVRRVIDLRKSGPLCL